MKEKQFYLYPFVDMAASLLIFILLPFMYSKIFAVITFLIGGVFPIYISKILYIDTIKHIKEQALILFFSIIACISSWYILFNFVLIDWIIVFLPAAFLLLSMFFFILKIKEINECFYLFISNPLLYYVIFIILGFYVF